MDASYDLLHTLTGTRITFSPFTTIEGKAAVGIQTVCGGNWGCATRTPEEARAEWRAWMSLGAVDLRKKLVSEGCTYTREADGTVSMSVCVSSYDYDYTPEKYAPEGYVFARHALGERDEYMSRDEVSWVLYFKPVAA